MNINKAETYIDEYEAKLEQLDGKAKEMSAEAKREYLSMRERFAQRLDAWRKSLESDMTILKNNLEDGYRELETKLIQPTK